MNLQLFAARARVVLTGFVTWLVVLSVVLAQTAQVLAEHAPAGWDAGVRWVGTIAAVVGSAIAIIRRVTQVLPEERGLLPVPSTSPEPTPDDVNQPDQ